MRKRIVVALMLAVCFAVAGCGDSGVLNPDADKEGVTDESWSQDVWNVAVENMFAKGYATRDADEGVIFECSDTGEIDLSEEGKAALTSSDFKIDGKVIWGSIYATMSADASPRLDPCAGSVKAAKESAAAEAAESSGGTTQEATEETAGDEDVPYYTSEDAVPPTSPDVFADSRGRCKYLVLMTALCYNIGHEYYMGNVDRLDIATYVFVIDAVNKEVVHVEFINSDRPGAVAHSYMGEIYEQDAYEYMNKICREVAD